MQKAKKYLSIFILALLLLNMLPTNFSYAAKKVKLSTKKLSLKVKQTKTLKLKNSKKKVKWTVTSGKKYIKLKSKKKTSVKLVGKKGGKAKVQAKVGKKKYVCKVTVKNVKVIPKPTVAPTKKPTSTEKPIPSEKPTPTRKPIPTDIPDGYNADDVMALRELIWEQRSRGATVSEDILNESEYEWENGRLIGINWGGTYEDDGKELSGNLDVSKNTELRYLYCGSNNLSSLDVSENTKLETLSCYYNKIGRAHV